MNLLLWLLVINLAVIVHELAHYGAAKMQGVAVRAYSVGMGPILVRRTWRGTEWRLSALPLGGYVEIDGMAPRLAEDGRLLPSDSGFARLPYLGKLWVLFAGPLSNVVLAIILLTGALTIQGRAREVPGPAVLAQVVFDSPADRAGFEAGDRVTGIDGQPLSGYEQFRASLQRNGSRVYAVRRGARRLDLHVDWSPSTPTGGKRPLFGVSITPVVLYDPVGVGTALGLASSQLVGSIPATVLATVRGIASVFTFSNSAEVAGPIGQVSAVGSFAAAGPAGIALFAALFNLSIGVFNLLPVPILDGGRMLLATVAAVRRRPLRPEQEEMITRYSVAFVLVMIVLVTIGDLSRQGG